MILIAKRRNHQWFEDDILKFGEIFVKDVLPEISISDMLDYMPESEEELYSYEKLLKFDWDQFEKTETNENEDNIILIKIAAPNEKEYKIFTNELKRIKEKRSIKSDWSALRQMAINSSKTDG